MSGSKPQCGESLRTILRASPLSSRMEPSWRCCWPATIPSTAHSTFGGISVCPPSQWWIRARTQSSSWWRRWRKAPSGAKTRNEFDEHAHPNRQRGVGEVVAVGVKGGVLCCAILRFHPDQEKAAGHFLEVVGEVFSAHGRLGDRD